MCQKKLALTQLQFQFMLGISWWLEKSEFVLLPSFIDSSCRSMTIETFGFTKLLTNLFTKLLLLFQLQWSIVEVQFAQAPPPW